MRLLFISNNFPPVVDGVGDYTFHLANEFARNGHEVCVLCSAKEEINEFVAAHELPYQVYPQIPGWGLKGCMKAYRRIRKVAPDWVVLQYVPYGFGKYGINFYLPLFLSFILLGKIRLLVHFHEFAFSADIGVKKRILSRTQKFQSQLIAKMAHQLSVSNKAIKQANHTLLKKAIVIPSGSNVLCHSPAPRWTLKKPQLMTISSFGAGLKYADQMIRVIEELKIKIPALDVHLVLIGKVEVLTYSGHRPTVSITGYADAYQVARTLSQSDIFLLPMEVKKNGWGGISTKSGSLAAALAHQLPVITTKGKMTDEAIFQHEENIYLVPFDWDNIRDAIETLYRDQELRKRISVGAGELYEKHFSWSSISEKYLKRMSDEQTISSNHQLQHLG
ncbi:MAG: glycosyltransferase family 4 protein [Cyclobacteriaceae bacterium]